MKRVADMEESSFAFKMDDYYLKKTTVLTELLGRRKSYEVSDAKTFLNYDQTFQPENHYMELVDVTKNSGVALKRWNAKVCLLDADGNQVAFTLKKHYAYPPTHMIYFFVKIATTNGASVIFKENKNERTVRILS